MVIILINVNFASTFPTEPSKPDVFFIKYKTKEEAEQAQQSIQGKDHMTLHTIM